MKSRELSIRQLLDRLQRFDGERLRSWLGIDSDAGVLWPAVLIGAGISIYFALGSEPPITVLLLATAALAAALLFTVSDSIGRFMVLGLVLVSIGFTVGAVRTRLVEAPLIAEEGGAVDIQGRLVLSETQASGARRILLDEVRISELAGDATPARIRLTVRTQMGAVYPGDRVSLRAVLLPLPGPVMPGGYDFARRLYYQQIGAVGFAISAVTIIKGAGRSGFSSAIETLRGRIDARIREVVPGDPGAIAAALVTGRREAISEAAEAKMRNAGLAHLLAISGLHLALIAGLVFYFVRLFLALIPGLAVARPIKKWAAGAAWVASLAYFLISGGSVSTQRAFIMISLVLLAVILERRALTFRTVSIAAIIILLLTPESLVTISFQMSFAAVIGLVAAYRFAGKHLPRLRRGGSGWVRTAALYFLGILATTVIAELSIAPFAAYHFNRLATLGLPANAIAVPLMGFWIMPLGLMALVMMPFGLDAPFLIAMGWGIELVLYVAGEVSALPYATLLLPRFPIAVLLLIITAGFVLLLHQNRRALITAAAVCMLAVGIGASNDKPVLLIDREGQLIALRGADDRLYLNTTRRNRFVRDIWLTSNAQRVAVDWQSPMPGDESVGCDRQGCLFEGKAGLVVAVPKHVEALDVDCQRAGLIILLNYLPPRAGCATTPIIDLGQLEDNGAHAIYWENGQFRVVTSSEIRGNRPWLVRPR